MNSVTLVFIPRLKNITTFWIYLLIAFQQIVYITENEKKQNKKGSRNPSNHSTQKWKRLLV